MSTIIDSNADVRATLASSVLSPTNTKNRALRNVFSAGKKKVTNRKKLFIEAKHVMRKASATNQILKSESTTPNIKRVVSANGRSNRKIERSLKTHVEAYLNLDESRNMV